MVRIWRSGILAHDAIDVYKGSLQFQKNAKALKRRVIPKRQMGRYKKERDAVIGKIRQIFRNPYGWAEDVLKPLNLNRPVNFADLEANVRQEKWRHLYKQASWNVHAIRAGWTWYRMDSWTNTSI